jgi:hypothetical protein
MRTWRLPVTFDDLSGAYFDVANHFSSPGMRVMEGFKSVAATRPMTEAVRLLGYAVGCQSRLVLNTALPSGSFSGNSFSRNFTVAKHHKLWPHCEEKFNIFSRRNRLLPDKISVDKSLCWLLAVQREANTIHPESD